MTFGINRAASSLNLDRNLLIIDVINNIYT